MTEQQRIEPVVQIAQRLHRRGALCRSYIKDVAMHDEMDAVGLSDECFGKVIEYFEKLDHMKFAVWMKSDEDVIGQMGGLAPESNEYAKQFWTLFKKRQSTEEFKDSKSTCLNLIKLVLDAAAGVSKQDELIRLHHTVYYLLVCKKNSKNHGSEIHAFNLIDVNLPDDCDGMSVVHFLAVRTDLGPDIIKMMLDMLSDKGFVPNLSVRTLASEKRPIELAIEHDNTAFLGFFGVPREAWRLKKSIFQTLMRVDDALADIKKLYDNA